VYASDGGRLGRPMCGRGKKCCSIACHHGHNFIMNDPGGLREVSEYYPHSTGTRPEELARTQVQLEVLDQALETRSPTGRILFQVLGAIAAFETALRKAR
jgi:hypothetical protein